MVKPLQSEAKVSKLMDVIQKNTDLRLDDFKSMDEVYRYVDAIASSGSTEEAKGCVFVLGNTSSGKSSLVQTLRNYSKDKAKTPKPVLSGDEDNKAYLETRVLDIVEFNADENTMTIFVQLMAWWIDPDLSLKSNDPNE